MVTPDPTVTTVDLRTDVPAGWKLAGLSGPKFDGINYYRMPEADRSALTFKLDAAQFVEFEYQLYSPAQAVTAILRLDNQLVYQRTFAAGVFEPPERAGTFVAAGIHTATWEYQCNPQPCNSPVKQYWTQMRMVKPLPSSAQQVMGLHTERLLLDAPDSRLTMTGTGALRFQGSNFVRYITDKKVQLSWPEGRALNASLYVYAPQPFRVTTTVQGRVVDVQQGTEVRGVSSNVSLTRFPNARSLTVSVECLGGNPTRECAYVQFPQVTLDTTAPVTLTLLCGAFTVVVIGLAALWRLLSPVGN